MIKEFAKGREFDYSVKTKQNIERRRWLVDFFFDRLYGQVLNIGDENPLCDDLVKAYNLEIEYTYGDDLDVDWIGDNEYFDIVLYLDVMEHQFNPLFTMMEVKKVLKKNGTAYIGLPRRPHFLWSDEHFHEIDEQRFKFLMDRAGFYVVGEWEYKYKREWWQYLTGVRMFLRSFFEKGVVYQVCKL